MIIMMIDVTDEMDAFQSCCCCLRRPPDKGLKTLYTHLGKTEIYSDMLKECFAIEMNLANDECGICEVCVGRLRDASDFKLQVQRSQAELQRLQGARSDGDDDGVKTECAGDEATPSEDVRLKLEMSDDEMRMNEGEFIPSESCCWALSSHEREWAIVGSI